MTAVEELRAAAEKLRRVSNVALMDVLTSPFWHSETVPASDSDGRYAHGVRGGLGGPPAELAALFTPGAVTAVAEWLDFHADMDERLHSLVDGTPGLDEATWNGKPHPALVLARLINRKETSYGRA